MKNGWRRNGLIALLLVFVAGCGKDEPPVIEVAPPERHEITYRGEIRYVFAADHKTVLEKHVPYGNGDIGHQYFREDGTLKMATEHYAPRGGDEKGQLKSSATWSEDGKTFQAGEIYRPAGSLLARVKSLPDGTEAEEFYLPGGRLLLSTKKAADRESWIMSIHRPAGTVIGKERNIVNLSNGSPAAQYMEGYAPDGQTLAWRIDYLAAGDDRIADFEPPQSGGQLITFFSSAGKPSHRQWWKSQWNPHTGKSVRLEIVEVFDDAGCIAEKILVEDTGPLLHLKEIRLPTGTVKQFRQKESSITPELVEKWKQGPQAAEKKRELQSGTLAKVLDASGRVVAEHKAAEKIRELLEPSLFRREHLQLLEEIEQLQAQAAAEDLSYLGKRDDSDPCRWYLKP